MKIREPRLLSHEDKIYVVNSKGMAYIKSLSGDTSNLLFSSSCIINTNDNSVLVEYTVEAFEPKCDDYCILKTSNYKEALDKYNELSIKFNGYR